MKLPDFFKHPLVSLRERHRRSHYRRLHTQAQRAINVTEYDGTFYLSFDGSPIMPLAYITTEHETLAEYLDEAREAYYNYLTDRDPWQ